MVFKYVKITKRGFSKKENPLIVMYIIYLMLLINRLNLIHELLQLLL